MKLYQGKIIRNHVSYCETTYSSPRYLRVKSTQDIFIKNILFLHAKITNFRG